MRTANDRNLYRIAIIQQGTAEFTAVGRNTMKNIFGNNLTLTIFGESHGAEIGAVIDGLTPGLAVDEAEIAAILSRRRPATAADTARREPDRFRIVSGVYGGRTTGTPLTVIIPNEDKRSSDYESIAGLCRPSHADYTAHRRFDGFSDPRGGGHFSGRITAALVAAGGIFLPTLRALGINVGTHICRCAGIDDAPLPQNETELSAAVSAAAKRALPVTDEAAGERMLAAIAEAKRAGDSVGGICETVVLGMPAGVGEPWFDSIESAISHAVFSLGGVKGIEFGGGFALADMRGSEANDPMRVEGERVVTTQNNSGGISGGITNGMPIIFRTAVKPTPSIAQTQKTVDIRNMTDAELTVPGRHDPAIVRRICPVLDSITAHVICDMLISRYGAEYLRGGKL